MNEVLINNLYILKDINNYLNIKKYLSFKNDFLYLNVDGKIIEINLLKINLKEIYNDNLKKYLSSMNIYDFAKLLEFLIKKEQILPKGNLDEEQKDNPKIKYFKVFKKFREDGSFLEYPYYIDENNNLHVLFNYASTNILIEYQKLFIKLGGNVSSKDLYEALEHKMKNVPLYADYSFISDNIREAVKLESDIVNGFMSSF